MRVLGITGGIHSCGLALVENGKPIFAFEEERFCRIKTYKDFEADFHRYPLNSWNWAKSKYPEYLTDIDYITGFFPPGTKFVEPMLEGITLRNTIKAPYIEVSHHESHCNLAYYLSGFQEDTLVISIDASGNNHSAKYYLGQNGNLIYIDGLDLSRKSLGHYYSMLTEFLGFKRLKDEGKVVGMASHGHYDSVLYDIFNQCITVDGYLTDLDNSSEVVLGGIYKDFYNLFYTKTGSKAFWTHKSNIAFNGQLVFEEKILQIIDHLHNLYPKAKKIALAGGVFANIKVNKRINELPWVDEVFVAPPMGDEGTPLGCALATYKKFNPDFKPFKLNDAFLGVEFTDQETEENYWDQEKFNRRPYTPEQIAWDLKEGKIIGWFQGRYEHGPRALCNRSIIADPSVPGTYKKVNDRLQRNDFMPFAPVVIDKYANEVFNVTKSAYTAEFMTMLYNTREEWQEKIPAVVHPIDKTARIQIVTENSNPKFYKLINKFNDITSIPVLLNTSFNIHEEPIICTPKEGFVHLENNIVDVLVIGNFIFTKK